MLEKDINIFYDTSNLTETSDLFSRCKPGYIEEELKKRLHDEKITVKSAVINKSGQYKSKAMGKLLSPLNKIADLPDFCDVRIEHTTGDFAENITVWVPLKWNDRFIGTGGGGTATGGEKYITKPNNTSRAMTLPKALLNGFASATTDAGATKNFWAVDKKTSKINYELIENWNKRSTHNMTIIGKAVAEILHNRTVLYSYFHGGSGGGRQSMVEVQEYPEDYNGVWATCPAINWSKFLLGGIWPIALMNERKHILHPDVIKYFMKKAQESVGGKDVYYSLNEKVNFDARKCVPDKIKGKTVTNKDADIMNEIWRGPTDDNGNLLMRYFRPGVLFWNVGIPVGAFYYTLIKKTPKPFILSTYYARWVTGNPKDKFDKIGINEWNELYKKSLEKYSDCLAYKHDLTAFESFNGKLIIDHGIDDPLIPVDSTIDYYNNVCKLIGSAEKTESFIRLFVCPGAGHGSCNWHNGGITDVDGMRALIAWVEQGAAPDKIRIAHTDKKGKLIKESEQSFFRN